MADSLTTDRSPGVDVEDLLPVRSRISWGAVTAGAVLALALYFLLTLLGAATGFSIGGNFEARNVGMAAGIYAIVITAFCLFVGGVVAAQLTVGENKREAALYGLMVWAVVFAMLLYLTAAGVRAGFTGMVGVATAGGSVANAAGQNFTQADFENFAKKAGYTQQQIDDFKAKANAAPADARAAANDPATQAKAEEAARDAGEAATKVTWYAFLGTFISMLAAALGGVAGAGPTFELFAVQPRRRLDGTRPALA